MALEVVQGESRNRTTAKALADRLRALYTDGTLYLGYPVLAAASERVDVDGLLVTQEHGLVAFLLADDLPTTEGDWLRLIEQQDRLYTVLESHLGRHEALRQRRGLALTPATATVFASEPDVSERPTIDEGYYGSLDDLNGWLDGLPAITPEVEQRLQAALQHVTTIKPTKKRTSVVKTSSKGAKMKQIERGIANLDMWQKQAAIETPEGPQRIRGLAGSGKTVVLAHKAAYLHTQHPDWHIALTFQSRALYQQVDDLVTRFTFEQTNDRPDPEYLRIVHSWGSRSRPGVYSLIATALGETPRDFAYASGKYGRDAAFQGVCQELLALARLRAVVPIFDAVLIDEAQDLPPEFFQLVYLFTKPPKRVVWGYDELQKLSEAAMPSTDELFGTGPGGEPLISLTTGTDEPRRDIVLPVCYRNTPWALTTAHALGIGVYRDGGLVQHPSEPTLWKDIGYNVLSGALREGENVSLQRSATSYPSYFPELIDPAESISFHHFEDEAVHDAWIAEEIYKNINDDELEPDDILVVLPDTYRAKSRAPRLIRHLWTRGIASHLVGVNTSVDEVFQTGSVALAHVHRAKGNEAPMVYAIDSQRAATATNIVSSRNVLFTAITRSRAWVRVTGWGDRMQAVEEEARTVVEKDYTLNFTIPTLEELDRLRHIHRDRPELEEAERKKATAGLAFYLEAVERGAMDFYDLPPAMRTKLVTSTRPEPADDDG